MPFNGRHKVASGRPDFFILLRSPPSALLMYLIPSLSPMPSLDSSQGLIVWCYFSFPFLTTSSCRFLFFMFFSFFSPFSLSLYFIYLTFCLVFSCFLPNGLKSVVLLRSDRLVIGTTCIMHVEVFYEWQAISSFVLDASSVTYVRVWT